MIEKSIELGLKTITFTDHLDLDYAEEPGLFELDLANYVPKILQVRETYQKDIEILLGLELGLQPHLAEIHGEIVNSYPWDYVIGSSHVVKGVDPYYPAFWENHSEEEGYRLYFESILENINAFKNFDAYGHLDYIVRYGPNKDKFYTYEKYADILDIVLKAMIVENIALEVNAGAFRRTIKRIKPDVVHIHNLKANNSNFTNSYPPSVIAEMITLSSTSASSVITAFLSSRRQLSTQTIRCDFD